MAGLLLVGLAGCGDRQPQPVLAPPAAAPEAVFIAPSADQGQTPRVAVVLDVMQLVGKSEAEVSELLGQPSSCEDIHRARWCRYAPDQDEVMFVAGKADMITVQAMDAIAFNEGALDALGLAPAAADHADENFIRWESIPGLQEVTVFAGPGNAVDYAYVKVGKH